MATLTIRPTAPGDVTTIPYQEPDSGAHWEKVDDVAHDDDTTAVYDFSIGQDTSRDTKDLYALANHTIESTTINFVKVYARFSAGTAAAGAAQANIRIKTNGVEYEGTGISGSTGWTTVNSQYNTNPQAGGAWTWAQVDALQAGARIQVSSTDNKLSEGSASCTQVYVEVDYVVIVLPTVTTQAVDDIGTTSATGHGNITNTGGENCDRRGIVWDLASHGDPGNVAPGASGYANDEGTNGSFVAGAFTESLTGLPSGTQIFCRAYAHNSAGYSYGGEVNFFTDSAAGLENKSANMGAKMIGAGLI